MHTCDILYGVVSRASFRIEANVKEGILVYPGYAQGHFRPSNKLIRSEM